MRLFKRKQKNEKKLFGNEIEPNCDYCANSSSIIENTVCKLGLHIELGKGCSRFQYDPLKRAPVNLPPIKPHDPDEFKL